MADVFGSIGNEPVELNNAATEATLKLLLNATMAANKQTLDQIKTMVKGSGIDPETVERVNTEYSKLYKTGAYLGAVHGALASTAQSVADNLSALEAPIKEIVSGSGNISGTLGALGKLPGVFGLLFTGMSKLIGYQEELLKTYQNITRVGANFGGSLTDMRQAAADTYMTLEEFSQVITENGENFARMGTTVNDGVKAFRTISNEINKSDIGRDLRALGMTTKEINDETIKYIASTGGRSRKELENTEAIRKSTGEYLTELDALTKFTGVSKKKLEEEQKKAQMNEAFQRKMASMGEEERAKLKAAYDKAAASGIAGATDLVMSAALGLPPVTEAAQQLSGIAPKAAEGFTEMTKTAMTTGTTQKDVSDKFGKALLGARDAAKNLGQTGDALVLQQGKQAAVVNSLIAAENKLRAKGITDEETLRKELAKVYDEQIAQQESEAKQAVETQKAVQELGQEMLKKLLPIVKSLWNAINPLITTVTNLVSGMLKVPYLFETLGVLLTAIIALYTAYKAKLAINALKETFGGGGGARGIADRIFNRGGAGGDGGGGGGGGAGPAAGAAGQLGTILDKIGPTIKSLGTGFGGAIKAIFKGIAGGLAAFANPKVVLGSIGFGVAIAAVGAGIAGAAWLLGKALPTLAEGMKAFEQLDGERLLSAGKGIAALGAALVVFGAGSGISAVGNLLGGLVEKFSGFLGIKSPIEKIKEFAKLGPGLEQAGKGIKDFNVNLAILLNTDLSKTKNVVDALNQIKAAAPRQGLLSGLTNSLLPGLPGMGSIPGPGLLSGLTNTVSSFFTKSPETKIPGASNVVSEITKNAATLPPMTESGRAMVAAGLGKTSNEKTTLAGGTTKAFETLTTELQTLNKQTMEMLKYLKENADYSRKSVDAIRGLNFDMFKF